MFGKKKNHENDNMEAENKNNESGEELMDNEQADNTADSPQDEMEKERQKYSELHDKYLRLHAEFDNFRRRTNKEKAELIQHANKDLLLHILPVFDDFERAKEAAHKSEDREAILHGLDLIFNKFRHVLNNAGLKEIDTRNQEFDSEIHDAITTIPAPTEEMKGKIIDQIQKGYTLNDKVIRHAKVVVGE